jgi:hypothetical protein
MNGAPVIFDDHRVPPMTLEEIEAEADRCRSYGRTDGDGRIDMFELLKALNVKLDVRSDSEMADQVAYSVAGLRQIRCRRSVSRGLRFGVPEARYVVGHEIGHMFLHRGSAPKARKIDGNERLAYISENESAETQAWKFARALFVTRFDLTSGEDDEAFALRVGIPTGAVSLRREEVRKAMQAKAPKVMPSIVATYLQNARSTETKARAERKIAGHADVEHQAAWDRAAQIAGENPAEVRCARGFRVERDHFGLSASQVGWTVVRGEVRSYMDLQSR